MLLAHHRRRRRPAVLLRACRACQALVPLKTAVDAAVIPAVQKAAIRDAINALTRK